MDNEPIDQRPIEEQAEMALIEAVDELVEENARLGIPIYVWQDGKVVDIGPQESAKRGYPPKTH